MKYRLLATLAILLSLAAPAFSQAPAVATKPEIMPVEQLRPGMRGVAYTVFQGTQPEAMEVEVLGVLKNMTGPKGDVILVRLGGEKAEFTGVVAGMSGSPVYIEGKLVGALAFRFGQFSKEPIGGVTPIAEMLEIDQLDRSVPPGVNYASTNSDTTQQTSSAAVTPSFRQYASQLTPIRAPLTFSGFLPETLERFGAHFEAAGVMPVMGAGGISDLPQPEPLVPGSAVSAVLVRGDMSMAATCTVTYVDPQRLLACGHPLLQFGMVDMPMTKASVVYTLASPFSPYKIVNATERVGAFVQDRHTGVLGLFGREPQMIPVRLTVHGGPQPRTFNYEVLNNSKLTPVAIMATVFNSLRGMNDYGEEITYRLEGRIRVAGYPDVTLQNMFAPSDAAIPTAFAVAMSLGDRFGRIYQNPYAAPQVEGVELAVDLVRDRRWARLETARTDVTEARPGDEIVIEAVLRPYRGERIVRQIPVRVPTSAPKGTLRILVSDGETLDRTRLGGAFGGRMDLGSTIALLNKQHANHHLYVSLLQANPQAMVEDKVMPALPLSVMNVMDGMRGTREMVVVGESATGEASTPLDYVVSGAQVISITVK